MCRKNISSGDQERHFAQSSICLAGVGCPLRDKEILSCTLNLCERVKFLVHGGTAKIVTLVAPRTRLENGS
jgi:hypothetical protein